MGVALVLIYPCGKAWKNPLSPRASSCRIGPRRQGFAAPLRALDCSGPIRKTRCSRGERGGSGRGVAEAESLIQAHDKGYYHSLKEPPPAPHPRPPASPRSSPPKHPPGDGLALYRAVRRPSCSTPRSRARLRKSPSRRPARSPAKGDLQQTLADYLEAAGLQEAPNDTPLSRTAISKTSQLTDNALHANDISHMMKRRLKDGSLRRPRRPAHHPAL